MCIYIYDMIVLFPFTHSVFLHFFSHLLSSFVNKTWNKKKNAIIDNRKDMIAYLLLILYVAFIYLCIICLPIIISSSGCKNVTHFIYILMCMFIPALCCIICLVVKQPAYTVWFHISKFTPIFSFVTDNHFILKSV